MNIQAMNRFLSEDNIKRHLGYYNNLKLKLSIFEKSHPGLSLKTPKDVTTARIDRSEKAEILDLMQEIMAHKCYFDSFTNVKSCLGKLNEFYQSVESFYYNVYIAASGHKNCFLYLYMDRHGAPIITTSDENESAFLNFQPKLALDLFEHAYLLDYGFDRDKYLRLAISSFNISKLDSLDNVK